MGVFDDKKFAQLDWMSQITETIESDLNDILAKMPNRVEFDIDRVRRLADYHSSFSVWSDSMVNDILSEFDNHRASLSGDEINALKRCFKFEMSPVFEVDFESDSMVGSLALVKTVPTLSDEELQPLMGLKGVAAIRNVQINNDEWPLDRLNEILEILGKCDEARRTRSHKKKLEGIKKRLKEIFATNEWRIRDMHLADRVGMWITEYISTGNLAALTNLCKLKVMTHNNMPIYSVEEEK